jgi:hypothetical protein
MASGGRSPRLCSNSSFPYGRPVSPRAGCPLWRLDWREGAPHPPKQATQHPDSLSIAGTQCGEGR